ncbi:uncharacterized protein LOC116001170 [Ipomoea triloba]|uniref:uncharacterized protein LOC116001170 n=1 Tax=Ipomoea triloba TaxID=35885 RepID=UPI00125D6DE7|nr:uncharacterized protein LOC116001170 [Ipomoea triloba]
MYHWLLGNKKVCGGIPKLKLPPCALKQRKQRKHLKLKAMIVIFMWLWKDKRRERAKLSKLKLKSFPKSLIGICIEQLKDLCDKFDWFCLQVISSHVLAPVSIPHCRVFAFPLGCRHRHKLAVPWGRILGDILPRFGAGVHPSPSRIRLPYRLSTLAQDSISMAGSSIRRSKRLRRVVTNGVEGYVDQGNQNGLVDSPSSDDFVSPPVVLPPSAQPDPPL